MLTSAKKLFSAITDRELSLNAASLSFYTIFTIVPSLMIIMSIVSYSDFFEQKYIQIQEMIITNFLPVNQDVIMGYIDNFLKHSIKMSLFSFVVLLISSLLFFKNYEYVVNKIFNADRRGFLRSLGVYFLIMVVTPVSLILVFSVSIFLISAIDSHPFMAWLEILPVVPTLVLWMLFFVLFKLSANINVTLRSALISSLTVTVMFSLAKEVFIYYVFLNKSYTTLYGSFSILMFLFLWIYASWFIFLNGLKLCNHLNTVDKNSNTLK
jgi:membrane protein